MDDHYRARRLTRLLGIGLSSWRKYDGNFESEIADAGYPSYALPESSRGRYPYCYDSVAALVVPRQNCSTTSPLNTSGECRLSR